MTKKEIGYVIPSFKGRRHEVPRGTERQIQNKANFLSISSLLSSIWHPCPEGGKSEPYLAGVGNLSQNFQVFSAEYKWYIFKYGGVLSFTSKSLSRKLWFDGFNPWCTVIHQAITIQLNSCFCAWTSWLTRSLVTWHNFWRRSFDSEQQAYPDLTLLARLVRSKANCATAHKPLL